MMGFKKVFAVIAPHYYQVMAEDAWCDAARSLAAYLTPEHIRYMAENGMGFGEALREFGVVDDDMDNSDDPGVKYLSTLPDDYLLDLLDQAVPEQAVVIRRYPEFAKQMLADLRAVIGGINAGNA